MSAEGASLRMHQRQPRGVWLENKDVACFRTDGHGRISAPVAIPGYRRGDDRELSSSPPVGPGVACHSLSPLHPFIHPSSFGIVGL